jgi:hypothetical protein
MRSDYEYLKKLVDNLIEPGSKLKIEDRSSLNDYFYFLTLEGLEDEQKGIEIFEVYTKLGNYCEEKKIKFYVGFFFSLSELLTVKYRIKAKGHELTADKSLSKEEWEKRFDATKKRLNL